MSIIGCVENLVLYNHIKSEASLRQTVDFQHNQLLIVLNFVSTH